MANAITVWNRAKACEQQEQVYGEGALTLAYANPLGRSVTHLFLTRPWLSRLYGNYQDSRLSRKKVAPFIAKFQIPMEQYEDREFRSFNDFLLEDFALKRGCLNKMLIPCPHFARDVTWPTQNWKPTNPYP